ncbi:hypothetical protein Hsc_3050 [Herbaspirillum seropedicae]|nr:hypothetical protein Hsc_3050 [Herbaspirillum seropedicae]
MRWEGEVLYSAPWHRRPVDCPVHRPHLSSLNRCRALRAFRVCVCLPIWQATHLCAFRNDSFLIRLNGQLCIDVHIKAH